MVEYKAYLKLKIPQRDNIMGLSYERYEVIKCEYEFHQNINHVGEVCSALKGGRIELIISDLPTDELMAWVFDHAKRYNGEITIFDTDEETIEQVYFEKARCVDFKMYYKVEQKPHIQTKLILIAEKIQLGEACFENLRS